jgi:hypothetical protein
MAAGNTYTQIASTTLGSASASVTFSSIPSTYTDLVLVGSISGVSATIDAWVRVGNGSVDTATNYSWTVLSGNGTTAASGRGANQTKVYWDFLSSITNVPQFAIMNFMNFSNTTTNKNFSIRGTSASQETNVTFGLWRSTSAINTIQIGLDSTATYSAGTTFSLYGITAA